MHFVAQNTRTSAAASPKMRSPSVRGGNTSCVAKENLAVWCDSFSRVTPLLSKPSSFISAMFHPTDLETELLGHTNRIAKISAALPFSAFFAWLFTLLFSVLLPLSYVMFPEPAIRSTKTDDADEKVPQLFPSIDEASIDHEPAAPRSAPAVSGSTTHPQPCSTGLTTRLLPFKNAKGEIEWALTDDLPLGSEFKSPDALKAPQKRENSILSPVTSNSSNNDSIISSEKPSITHQIDTPSSTASDYDKAKDDNGDGESPGESEEAGETGQPHQCPHCDSSFKMRGYLTRHLKKHSIKKAYRCPFHESSIYVDENDVTHKCHPTGGFSRRDTYKTHLKTRHFKYPEGLSSKERSMSPGNCSMCGEWFETGEIWCEIHIEGAECRYLPQGFKGKSRIKNRLKKRMNRLMKEQRKRGNNPCPMPIEQQSPIMNTPNSMTPGLLSAYDYNTSPTNSATSSVGPNTVPLSHDVSFRSGHGLIMPIQLGKEPLHNPPPVEDDYDDEFCLDTDQLSSSVNFRQEIIHPVSRQASYLNSYF